MTKKAMAISVLCAPLVATLLFAGAAPAQTSDLADPGMLPDHPLYFMKSASEGVGTFFTFGDANEAERALELSEKRLAEARALADQGKPEAAERAVDRYQAQLDRAVTKAEEARARAEAEEGEEEEEAQEDEDADQALTRVAEATRNHQAVLAEVYEKVPEQARPGIKRAMQASKRGHDRANKAKAGPRGGRPDSPGRSGPRRRGPPDSAESEGPDGADRGPPRDRGRPDSVAVGKPDDADRGPPGDRSRPDSVEVGRLDTAGGQ